MHTNISAPHASVAAPGATLSDESLTFGVELEFVFAFHESLLDLTVTNGSRNKIEKDLSYNVRQTAPFTPISPTGRPKRVYNSWGICRRPSLILPYSEEPVEVLSSILAQQRPDLEFRSFGSLLMSEKTKEKYNHWMICKDRSVCGVGSRNIFPGRLDHRSHDDRPEEWDSIGLEVVSKVYNSGFMDDATADIKSVVEALKGKADDEYGSFLTNQCALHVHVQAPERLEVLEELAIILLIYEEEISRLHPPCRRPHNKKGHNGPRGHIDSNRLFWIQSSSGLDWPLPSSRKFQEMNRTLAGLKAKYPTVDELRTHLRHENNRDKLISRMNAPAGKVFHRFGNRNRLVNFTTAASRGDDYPQTIEFRQARGSLDAEEIKHWVEFCIGLVKLATLYSESPDKFPIQNWPGLAGDRDRIDVFDLMKDMRLGDNEVEYWERKIALYQSGQPGDENDRTDNETPPEQSPIYGRSEEGHGSGGQCDDLFAANDDEDGNEPGKGAHCPECDDERGLVGNAGFPNKISPKDLERHKNHAVNKGSPLVIDLTGSDDDGADLPDYESSPEPIRQTGEDHGNGDHLPDYNSSSEAVRILEKRDTPKPYQSVAEYFREQEITPNPDLESEETGAVEFLMGLFERSLINKSQRQRFLGAEGLPKDPPDAEEYDWDGTAFHGLLNFDYLDARGEEALELYSEIIGKSRSLLCRTIAHLCLGYDRYSGLVDWRDARDHLQTARSGFIALQRRYAHYSEAIWNVRNGNLHHAWLAMESRRSHFIAEKYFQRYRPCTISSFEDAEIENRRSGSPIKNFNPAEWMFEIDQLPDSDTPLPKSTQVAYEIYSSIVNQFPHSLHDAIDGWGLDKMVAGVVMKDLRERLEALDQKAGRVEGYYTNADISMVLSDIRKEPLRSDFDEDNDDDSHIVDYDRLQFNLAIFRGPLATPTKPGVGYAAEWIDNGFQNTLYMASSFVNGMPTWQAMKPASQPEAPINPQIETEVIPFDSTKWKYEEGALYAVETPSGTRRNVTAANALFESMVKQYPASIYARKGSPLMVLRFLDSVDGGAMQHHQPAQVQAALRAWTNSKWALVFVKRAPGGGKIRWEAVRMGRRGGPEVYVKYRELNSVVCGLETRWQGMGRKEGPLPYDVEWETEDVVEDTDNEFDEFYEDTRQAGWSMGNHGLTSDFPWYETRGDRPSSTPISPLSRKGLEAPRTVERRKEENP